MQEVSSAYAPASIGPFSQAVITHDTVYVSGQGPIDPDTDEIVDGSIEAEIRQTLENIAAVLDAADASLDDVVKTTVFVRDMNNYAAINEVYASYFTPPYPARSAVEVSNLPVDIGVEIEAIARR